MVEAIPLTPAGTLTFRLGALGVTQEARYAERLSALGLRPRHVALLSALRLGGTESQQELANSLGIAPSLVVLLADQLGEMRAIERVRDAADRRRQHLHLTAEGIRLLEAATALAVAMDDERTAPLSLADRAALARILEKLATEDGI